ncbi:MAG: CRISPR-associated endonuclease Cas3'', partial [Desulfomonilaceae bacterium]|nr:CRISPR-associated endonuclease Cas3'' [Desulfomonilaceae bacterium]
MNSNRSRAYFQYWGKVMRDKDEHVQTLHLLPYHCLDVAAVGRVLLNRDAQLQQRVCGHLPLKPEDVDTLVILFLALHDIGKFSIPFQSLVEEAVKILRRALRMRPYSRRHTDVGLALWEDRLLECMCSSAVFQGESDDAHRIGNYILPLAQPFLGHHGLPADSGDVLTCEQFLDEDVEAAIAFLYDCARLFVREPVPLPQDLGTLYDALKVRSWLLSGFAVVCDWIGSNSDFFPYCSDEMVLDDYWLRACDSAERAVDEAGILPVKRRQFSGMAGLFPELKDFWPSPLQAHVSQCDIGAGPQLWIIEDITGSGKTEAAIVLLHRLMQQGYDGFFLALPTMATA